MAGRVLIIRKVLLSFQFCLGFWQIVKLTGFAAILKAFVSRLGTFASWPYSRLKEFENGPYFGKYGECLVTREGEQPTVESLRESSQRKVIKIDYLGKTFRLERKEGDKLFVNDQIKYYITDLIWHSVLNLETVDNRTVFLQGHQILFTELIIGGVMELPNVLDSLILRNHVIKSLSHGSRSLFLPINLSISEGKLLKALNLVGLFLQAKNQVYWLIPTLLSLSSAVLEFSTPLRVWIYSKVNIMFCWIIHAFCDHLPLRARMWLYSLFDWVENLRPSNDIEWRIVRGNLDAMIGGGAKAQLEKADEIEVGTGTIKYEFPFNPWNVTLQFDEEKGKGKINRLRFGRRREYFEVDYPGMDELRKLSTFINCLAENRSGSLESCEPSCRVYTVRGFKESVLCYAKNGFPNIYKLKLKSAVLK